MLKSCNKAVNLIEASYGDSTNIDFDKIQAYLYWSVGFNKFLDSTDKDRKPVFALSFFEQKHAI